MVGTFTVTSSEANKMIRELRDKRSYILAKEYKNQKYTLIENHETDIPDYSYTDVQRQLNEINSNIRTIKHAINKMNINTHLPNFEDLTIDQALIYLPQLSERKDKLNRMRLCSEKERSTSMGSSSAFIEYTCTNYDIETVDADYYKISQLISDIQLDLDLVNSTEKIELVLNQ